VFGLVANEESHVSGISPESPPTVGWPNGADDLESIPAQPATANRDFLGWIFQE
jgi:hypothetical protein